MSEKRFEVTGLGGYIVDNLTGKLIPCHDIDMVCDFLNAADERANKNAEKFDSFNDRLYPLIENISLWDYLKQTQDIAIENIQENLKYRKVMDKYNIDSVEKLDLMLFWQKKW